MARLRRNLLLASALCAAALSAEAAPNTPPLPHQAPQARPAGYDAAAENKKCEECHAEIAAEWRGSLHHQAWDDPVFLKAYALEPLPFCRACHVPEADPAHLPPEPARRLGVGCVTCHAPEGEISSAHGQTATATRHASRKDARLATAQACQGCHQFEFPEPQEAAMQGTLEEHKASRFEKLACQECHMPLVASPGGGKHRDHDFSVIRDPAMLRSAISVRASRDSDVAITITLSAARVGHAVPTGDMFRRIEVRAKTVGKGEGDSIVAPPVVFARRFAMVPHKAGKPARRQQMGDDRIPASGEERSAELIFPQSTSGKNISWEVVYQRMPPAMASDFGVDSKTDDVILTQGILTADP